jgi:hypothetical protein
LRPCPDSRLRVGVACQINAKGGRGVWCLAGSQPGHTCIREAHRLAAGLLASRRAESASRCTVKSCHPPRRAANQLSKERVALCEHSHTCHSIVPPGLDTQLRRGTVISVHRGASRTDRESRALLGLSTHTSDLSRDQKASTAPPKPQKYKESSAP